MDWCQLWPSLIYPFMSTDKSDNVIIADTQFLAVETLRNLVGGEEGYRLCGVAGTREELVDMMGKFRNGLVIVDIANIGLESLEELKGVRESFPQFRIIGKADFMNLTKSGIKNILYKNADRGEILAAIQASLKGKKYFSEELIDMYMDINENKFGEDEHRNVTPSEIEIIRLIANGLTTKEIADKRNISYHTVSTHRKNIFRKIGVSNASELIMHAIKAGWIDNIEYYI